MAKVSITHAFPDGGTVTMTVESKSNNDYADAATDCINRVVELYRQVVPDEAES